jgi:hypothetical protein
VLAHDLIHQRHIWNIVPIFQTKRFTRIVESLDEESWRATRVAHISQQIRVSPSLIRAPVVRSSDGTGEVSFEMFKQSPAITLCHDPSD